MEMEESVPRPKVKEGEAYGLIEEWDENGTKKGAKTLKMNLNEVNDFQQCLKIIYFLYH